MNTQTTKRKQSDIRLQELSLIDALSKSVGCRFLNFSYFVKLWSSIHGVFLPQSLGWHPQIPFYLPVFWPQAALFWVFGMSLLP
ncbi:Uncharacterized protein TCM_032028 [Theobroma cacao]|uniref:Uncharacterized protein n=1 Tax=Theobroma cacao TaxID=3641 RepID=A0A061F979_THECC|nr:Uncharacterized protein TCM_032028 [Theobroma cacao]